MARSLRQLVAWTTLMATILALVLLLQAVATSALAVPVRAAPPGARVSATTTALPDGDDVRAGFPVSLPGETPMSCSVPATEDQACIS